MTTETALEKRARERDVDVDEFALTVRERRCVEMRRDGRSYREIADEMDLSVSTVHRHVRRALKRIVAEPSEEVRALEVERLDKMLAKCMDLIDEGSPSMALQAMDRAIRLVETRARLLGLNAAVKVDHRVTDAVDAQIEALAGELSRLHERVDAEGGDDVVDAELVEA